MRAPALVALATVVALVACSSASKPGPNPSTAGTVQPSNRAAIALKLAAALDSVKAIDNHTHLFQKSPGFVPRADRMFPLAMRSTNRAFWRAVRTRFGVADDSDRVAMNKKAVAAREAELAKDPVAYWATNLDAAKVDIALVNQPEHLPVKQPRLRWVPDGSALLYPSGWKAFAKRDPAAMQYTSEQTRSLQRALADAKVAAVPKTLADYLKVMDAVLAAWKAMGAVAIKVSEAYVRTLDFATGAATPAEASKLFGRDDLSRADFIRLQNYLAGKLFHLAGKYQLVVHFHTGTGRPPFMRLSEAAVRRLESVLADPQYFKTKFVVLHSGIPDYADAGYVAIKPHVWVDTSAVPMLMPFAEVKRAIRTLIIMAPESVVFGTDAVAMPSVPVGPEIHHIALAEIVRHALYQALADLVYEKVLTYNAALTIGRGVLRDNAARLYGFPR